MATYQCSFDLEDHDGAAVTTIEAQTSIEAANAFARGGDFPPNGRLPVLVRKIDDNEWERIVVAESNDE